MLYFKVYCLYLDFEGWFSNSDIVNDLFKTEYYCFYYVLLPNVVISYLTYFKRLKALQH